MNRFVDELMTRADEEGLLDVAYAGNKGTALPVDIQADQLKDQYLSLGQALLNSVPNTSHPSL